MKINDQTVEKGKDEDFVELGHGETGIKKKTTFYITTTCPSNNGGLRHFDSQGNTQ
jgi:hypothetical protein